MLDFALDTSKVYHLNPACDVPAREGGTVEPVWIKNALHHLHPSTSTVEMLTDLDRYLARRLDQGKAQFYVLTKDSSAERSREQIAAPGMDTSAAANPPPFTASTVIFSSPPAAGSKRPRTSSVSSNSSSGSDTSSIIELTSFAYKKSDHTPSADIASKPASKKPRLDAPSPITKLPTVSVLLLPTTTQNSPPNPSTTVVSIQGISQTNDDSLDLPTVASSGPANKIPEVSSCLPFSQELTSKQKEELIKTKVGNPRFFHLVR